MPLHSAGRSEVGLVRSQNEDAYLVDSALHLFMVADGMGGHAGGSLASALAVATIGDYFRKNQEKMLQYAHASRLDSISLSRWLCDAVRQASAAIYAQAKKDTNLTGMGTTVTLLWVANACAFIAHVGDSRCYLQRGSTLQQLTEDHSLVNEQVKAGLLTPLQARVSRFKNIITRSVGFEADVNVDTMLLPLQPNDALLLCSDGLSNLVDDLEISEILSHNDPKASCDQLVELALQKGGDDNVTVLSVVWYDEP